MSTKRSHSALAAGPPLMSAYRRATIHQPQYLLLTIIRRRTQKRRYTQNHHHLPGAYIRTSEIYLIPLIVVLCCRTAQSLRAAVLGRNDECASSSSQKMITDSTKMATRTPIPGKACARHAGSGSLIQLRNWCVFQRAST
jgi:hypothetical protein